VAHELISLARARFQNLKPAEELAIKAAAIGEVAVCGPISEYTESLDPFELGTDWAKRAIRADVVRWLCVEGGARELVQHSGIQIFAAMVVGELDMQYSSTPFPLTLQSCLIPETISFKNARLSSLILSGSHVSRILADGLEATNNILLNKGFESNSEVVFRDAKVGGGFNTTGAIFRNAEGMALGCDRMRVEGSVFASRAEKGMQSQFYGEVRFAGAEIGSNLECDGGSFQNLTGPAINADRLTTNGGVTLRNGFAGRGEVRFQNATIGTTFDCSHGTFFNPDGKALNAEGTRVGGSAFFAGDFTCTGSLHLWGIAVDGGVQCQAGKFTKIDLRRASIKGPLRWIDINNPSETDLDLRDATLGSIEDTEESWPQSGRLHIEGLKYERFVNRPNDVEMRLKWLRLDNANSSQPYRQLAAFYSELGEHAIARRVLYELEDRQYRRRSRTLGFLLKLTIGYGYRLGRAGWCLVVIFMLGFILSWSGYAHGLIVPTDSDAYKFFVVHREAPPQYQRFSSVIYSLEHSIPALNLGVSSVWSANTPADNARPRIYRGLRWWFWLQTALGWVLSIFFVAGLTGLVKSDA
jgi:hypothetical protein